MNIVTVLILILLGLAVGFAIILFQIIILARIQRTWSWWVGAGTFMLLAGMQIKGLVRLPSAIVEAQRRGYMFESLTATQWVDVVWSYAIVVGFIVFLDWLRRDLKKLGV